MLLHQSVLTMERNRVKVQVEAGAARQSHFTHGIEPQSHELVMGLWLDPTTVLGQEAALGHDVEPGEQRQSFIEDGTHDVAVTRRAKQFEAQQASQGVRRRNHLAAREGGL